MKNIIKILVITSLVTFSGCKKAPGILVFNSSDISEIMATKAVLTGDIEQDGGSSVTERGFCWSTSEKPTISDNYVKDGTGTGSYTTEIISLSSATTYYIRPYAINDGGIFYGEEMVFKTKDGIPTIVTSDITNITINSAQCGGNITDDGGAEITARGICWSTSPNPTISDNHTENGSGTGTFTAEMTDLTINTTYYVKAYATNSVGETYYGVQKSFKTLDGVSTIVTSDITNITINSARCGGNITDDGGAEITSRGICWSTSSNPTISDSHTENGFGTGSFTAEMADLTINTTYYVKAYGTNSVGETYYGVQKSFKTLDGVSTIVTSDITNITINSAQCGGSITDDGGAEITARGICWSTSSNPTISDNHTENGSGTGGFTAEMTDLTINTTYYVKAYATNSIGETHYGEQKSFKTKDGVPTIVTSNVTNITINSAQCGGNITDDGGSPITARGICWSTSSNPTISDNHTVDGSGSGSFTSEMTGLTYGATYYVKAYAINSTGTYYGESKSFVYDPYNGHGYVDLGLPSGLKWATCNVGSVTAEGYGNYYAWGETQPKSNYTADNSVTYGKTIEQLRSAGIIDSDNHLTPSYDAATANWGSTWRMPTKEEEQELVDECTWQWTTQSGVNGYRVTGPNGKSIFLPAAGYRYGTSLYLAGESGYYWSSTPSESYTYGAYSLDFSSSGRNVRNRSRYYGFTVRPVSE